MHNGVLIASLWWSNVCSVNCEADTIAIIDLELYYNGGRYGELFYKHYI